MSVSYPRDVIRDLLEGALPWEQTRQIDAALRARR